MTQAAPSKTVTAIVFDVGGVLLKLYPERSFAAFAEAGAPGFEKIWQDDTSTKSLHRLEIGTIEPPQFRKEVNEALGTTLPDAAFDRAFGAMIGVIEPDIFSLLDTLAQQLPLYVLSNNNILHLSAIEKKYPQFRSLFRAAYFSQEIQARKPDTSAFELTIDKSGVTAQSTLFVDDSDANIRAAESCGLQGLFLPRNSDLRAALHKRLPSTLGV